MGEIGEREGVEVGERNETTFELPDTALLEHIVTCDFSII